MRLIASGVNSYIGSTPAALWVEHVHGIVVVDDLRTAHRDPVPASALVRARRHPTPGLDRPLAIGQPRAGPYAFATRDDRTPVATSRSTAHRSAVGAAGRLMARLRRALGSLLGWRAWVHLLHLVHHWSPRRQHHVASWTWATTCGSPPTSPRGTPHASGSATRAESVRDVRCETETDTATSRSAAE